MNKINRLARPEAHKLENALASIGRDRIKAESFSQSQVADHLSRQLGFKVTAGNVKSAMQALEWKDWPTQQAADLAQRLAPSRQQHAVLDRLAKLEERLAKLESVQFATCPDHKAVFPFA